MVQNSAKTNIMWYEYNVDSFYTAFMLFGSDNINTIINLAMTI